MADTGKRRVLDLLVVAGLLCSTLSIGQLQSPALAQDTGCDWDPSWGIFRVQWVTEVVELTNQHRAELGLEELSVSRSLTRSTLWKAGHMAEYEYLEHDDPAPPMDRSWDQRIESCGYSGGAGENIAYGYRSPSAVFEGWLNSPGHRKNIERETYSAIGIGVATNEDGVTYWAQNFGVDDDSSGDTHTPPDAEDDVVDGPEDEPLSFETLDNDFDPDGDPFEIAGVTDPAHGDLTVSIAGRTVYTPDRNFFGEDSFTYTVIDVFGYSSEATVTLTVAPVNDRPTVAGESKKVRVGRPITVAVLANDTDVDGDILRIDRIVAGPRRGEVLHVDRRAGTITYRSKASAAGRRDRIVYRVTDGSGGSGRGRLRLKIKR